MKKNTFKLAYKLHVLPDLLLKVTNFVSINLNLKDNLFKFPVVPFLRVFDPWDIDWCIKAQ